MEIEKLSDQFAGVMPVQQQRQGTGVRKFHLDNAKSRPLVAD
ncbi:hypothetical protein B808_727 [Fructilactobacillus florum 8D]|uniref:Uncharacterized protein n=1 Tax=Fructilactobacillus florum 8D TaxID=1221538 RepID=W9EGJ6_9LACO|nr:hypothetical protein B808_727 [Fructilactobacillus florum 8D]